MSCEGWKNITLSEVCNVKHGYAFKGEYIVDYQTDYVLVSPGNFNIGGGFKSEKIRFYKGMIPDEFILREGNIIVTMTDLSKNGDTLGYSALVPKCVANEKYLHNQRIGLIQIINNCIDSGFLYWLLRTEHYHKYIVSRSSGSTVKHTSPKSILSYEFLLPPVKVQSRISCFLSSLDDKIELNNQINANLEQQAQAIFKSWFIDFEPFKNGEFIESELGLIPKGWKIGILSDIGEIVGGSTPSKSNESYYSTKGISWITPKDLSINKNKFIAKGEIDITKEGLKNSSANLMPKGSILFSSRAPIGYIAIAKNEVCTNQGFKSIVPLQEIGTAFIYYYLKEKTLDIQSQASGSTFKEVSGTFMKNYPVIIPDTKSLTLFNSICSSFFYQQDKNEDENYQLSKLRDFLLPKLMSGEIYI